LILKYPELARTDVFEMSLQKYEGHTYLEIIVDTDSTARRTKGKVTLFDFIYRCSVLTKIDVSGSRMGYKGTSYDLGNNANCRTFKHYAVIDIQVDEETNSVKLRIRG
jgi:hypothetical protein